MQSCRDLGHRISLARAGQGAGGSLLGQRALPSSWGQGLGEDKGKGSRQPTDKGPTAVQGGGGSQRRDPWALSKEGAAQPDFQVDEKATILVPVPQGWQVPLSKESETTTCLVLFSLHKGRILDLKDKDDI